ncbi:hypothetical protein L3X38_024933 [Prunus dulcis]|uniref:Uncharacterized protein n=1 Tax=Prunus dulcis TaxID=3755 RepID=A0AAD4W0Q4_PRUDU|nr:hypothetical protein L3X38_024933 [Prunus dulcis]
MYPEVAKVLEKKVSIKEEPPKAIVLCSRCQCEVTLEVVLPKPKEPTKEPTKGLIKEQGVKITAHIAQGAKWKKLNLPCLRRELGRKSWLQWARTR